MHLMEDAPEKVRLMACPMPPVKHEGSDEPPKQPFADRWHRSCDSEQRPVLQPLVPCDSGNEHDADLNQVQKGRADVPPRSFRQFSAWKNPFGPKKQDCSCDDHHDWYHGLRSPPVAESCGYQLPIGGD